MADTDTKPTEKPAPIARDHYGPTRVEHKSKPTTPATVRRATVPPVTDAGTTMGGN